MGFFGGVEWRTPIDKLTLKAEISSDAYTREQRDPDAGFDRKSRFNFGAEYRIRPGVTLGGYYMYGDTVGVNIVLSGNPKQPPVPQNLGQGPLPVNPRPADANRSTAWADDRRRGETVIEAIGKALDDEELTLEEIKLTGTTVDVFFVNRRINQPPKAIGRVARVLAIGMPYSVETFRITPVEDGLPTTTVTVNRTAFESQVNQPDAGPGELGLGRAIQGAVPNLYGDDVWRRDVYPLVDWAVLPVPSFYFFSGNEGFRPQLAAEFRGSVQVNRALSFSAQIRQPVLGVFDEPESDRNKDRPLPPVRREFELLLRGVDSEAAAADRRLPVQARPRHLCPRLGRHARAGVRGRQRRGAVEAGRAELGRRGGAELGGAARHLQLVRLRRVRLRCRDGPCLALLGHRLLRARGAGRRRALSGRRLGRDAVGAAHLLQRLGRSAAT